MCCERNDLEAWGQKQPEFLALEYIKYIDAKQQHADILTPEMGPELASGQDELPQRQAHF